MMYGMFPRQDNNRSGVTDLEIFSQNPTRSIFVRDLPYFCCSADLAKFFHEQLRVPILHAVVCKNKKRRTLQFGCVMFESEEHVKLAVDMMNGCRFVGRDIRVMVYDTNAPLEASSTGLIHVSFKALTPQCPLVTEAIVRESFEVYGDIEHVSIRSHKYSEAGMQGGYGFLTFRTPEQNKIVVDRVRQTIINDVLYDCSWSESNNQKVLGSEAGADFHMQESAYLGGRPAARSARPPVALHDPSGMASGIPSGYPNSADPRLGGNRAYQSHAPTYSGHGPYDGRPGYESSYGNAQSYDRRIPSGSGVVDPRLLMDPRLELASNRYPSSPYPYGDRDVAPYEYARRQAAEASFENPVFDRTGRPIHSSIASSRHAGNTYDALVAAQHRRSAGYDPRLDNQALFQREVDGFGGHSSGNTSVVSGSSSSFAYDEFDPRFSRLSGQSRSVPSFQPGSTSSYHIGSNRSVRSEYGEDAQTRLRTAAGAPNVGSSTSSFARGNGPTGLSSGDEYGSAGIYDRSAYVGSNPPNARADPRFLDRRYEGASGGMIGRSLLDDPRSSSSSQMYNSYHSASASSASLSRMGNQNQFYPGSEMNDLVYGRAPQSELFAKSNKIGNDASNDYSALRGPVSSNGMNMSKLQLPIDEYGLPKGRPVSNASSFLDNAMNGFPPSVPSDATWIGSTPRNDSTTRNSASPPSQSSQALPETSVFEREGLYFAHNHGKTEISMGATTETATSGGLPLFFIDSNSSGPPGLNAYGAHGLNTHIGDVSLEEELGFDGDNDKESKTNEGDNNNNNEEEDHLDSLQSAMSELMSKDN